MKKLRKISKEYYLKQIMVCWLVFYMLFCFGIPTQVAMAVENPAAGALPGGVIDMTGIDAPVYSPGRMDMTQTAGEAIVNWNNFDIGSSATVEFHQPGATAAVLNRVHDGDVTGIMGTLMANGRVFIINPAGIVFGKTATINVSQLVASSLNLGDDDFLNGAPYEFINGATAGNVTFNAKADNVTAERLFLIGKYVRNKGGLVATDFVVMAAGDKVIIGELDSAVTVEIDWTGVDPADYAQFKVENKDQSGDKVDTVLEADHVILAAGDLWSQAISDVKTVKIDVKGPINADDLDSITAYSGPGSDAVAGVSITSGSSITIDDDIKVEAVNADIDPIDGIPDGDTYASIKLKSTGGDLTINSKGSNGTTIEAVAHDGANNYATVELAAQGDVTVSAKDQVTIGAQAYAGKAEAVLNQAQVNIDAGGSVEIKGQDYGSTDAPATVIASASGAQTNRAGVDIQAEGDVLITGEGKEDDAIVTAEAYNGDENYATVVINAVGDVEILSDDYPGSWDGDGAALVEALAYNEEAAATLNEAGVQITGNSVTIEDRSDGDDGVEVLAIAHNGQSNNATIGITASGGNVTVVDNSAGEDDGVLVKAEAYDGQQNKAAITIDAAGDVDIIANEGDAGVLAYAHNAEISNEASVDITAGGDVHVKSEGGNLREWQTLNTPAYWDVQIKKRIEDTPKTYNVEIKKWFTYHYHYEWIYGVSTKYPDPADYGYAGWTRTGDTHTNPATYHYDYAWLTGASSTHPSLSGYPGWEYANDYGDPYPYYVHYDATYDDHSSFTPYVASVEAVAENAGASNTALVDMTAGGNVVVLSKDGGEARVEAYAGNALDSQNTATINLTAEDGYVLVHAIGGTDSTEDGFTPSEASVKATAEYAGSGEGEDISTNDATITIVATDIPDEEEKEGFSDGSVGVIAVNGGKAEVEAIAKDGDENLAGVDITADGDVKVIAECKGQPSEAEIMALAKYANVSNTAGVDIAASGDVKVIAEDGGEAEIESIAKYGTDNTATIGIDAVGGDVKVIAKERGDAAIKATAEYAENSNTADVTINATATTSEYLYEGDEQVYLEVDGGDVKVIAKEGGDAAITAFASESGGAKTNTANVTINATAAEGTMQGELVTEAVYEGDILIPAVYAAVAYTEGGDVKVIADKGGEAEIEALAIGDQTTNNADVLICIDGGVKVKGERGGEAEIEALAKGWDSTNTATVGIGAKGEEGVEVIADKGGEAGISSKAKEGETNTASTIVCTGGGVDVLAQRGGDAEIISQAKYGITNTAYTGIGAMGDVVVQTGEESQPGCDAVIRAEADTGQLQLPMPMPGEDPIITTTKAETVVFSHEGNVEVLAYNHGHSGIEAEAQGANLNTANVGVAAAADLTPADVAGDDSRGNVIVDAQNDGEAQILAYAHDAGSYEVLVVPDNPDTLDDESVYDMLQGENTAKTVICAPGEVRVETFEGGEARIKSRAGWYGDEEAINKATTRVYATDVKVNTSARKGQGIWAWAQSKNSDNPHVPGEMMLDYLGEPYDGSYYCMGEHGEVAWTDGDAVLYIQDYSKRVDCPDCPPCPCGEEQPALLAPVAPLAQYEIPRIEGCPALTQAAAMELGIPGETLQISIGNAIALNPSIQPCQACETLVNAASILRDEDGSRMAAMVQAFNTLAPADAPYTPETATSIAMAFEGAEEGTQYASAMEYIDAFVQYVAVLDTELGSPVGDSVAFVMDKYGAGITGSENGNIAAFVAARLEAISE